MSQSCTQLNNVFDLTGLIASLRADLADDLPECDPNYESAYFKWSVEVTDAWVDLSFDLCTLHEL